MAGNGVGSIADCQAMLDFAGEHGVNTAIERVEKVEKNDVRYRFVIDVAGSKMDTVA